MGQAFLSNKTSGGKKDGKTWLIKNGVVQDGATLGGEYTLKSDSVQFYHYMTTPSQENMGTITLSNMVGNYCMIIDATLTNDTSSVMHTVYLDGVELESALNNRKVSGIIKDIVNNQSFTLTGYKSNAARETLYYDIYNMFLMKIEVEE